MYMYLITTSSSLGATRLIRSVSIMCIHVCMYDLYYVRPAGVQGGLCGFLSGPGTDGGLASRGSTQGAYYPPFSREAIRRLQFGVWY